MIRYLIYLTLLIGIFLNAQVSAQPIESDTTFGGNGSVFTNNSGLMQDLAIQPDGKILTLGACRNINAPFVHLFCISRINEDGTTDGTFGGPFQPGSVLTRIPEMDTNQSYASSGVAVQSDDKILAVGFATIQGQFRPIYVRYHPDGTLDKEFGTGGIIISPIRGIVFELVNLPDDKFLVVGVDESSTSKQFIAHYSPDGTLDTSFGNNGIATLDIKGSTSLGMSIALQHDGKILTGGFISLSGESSYLLTRSNKDGSLDTTFDDDGYQIANYTSPTIITRQPGFLAIAPQVDGRILALGSSNTLYRFNSDGSIDTSFGEDGSREALGGVGANVPFDLVVTPSGKISVVGHRTIPNANRFPNFTPRFRVSKYLSNGSPDPSFGQDGFLEFSPMGPADGAGAVILDSVGRVVIGGHATNQILFGSWQNPIFVVARLIASPIQNVGFSGRVINSNGRPVSNAFVTLENNGQTIKIGRTNPFGYFRFYNVQSGQTYTILTRTKGKFLNQRQVLIDDEITNYLVSVE